MLFGQRSYLGPIKEAYGICWNEKPGKGFDYACAVAEKDLPSKVPGDFVRVSLATHRYAVFSHDGQVSEITKKFDFIHRLWLPKSGWKSSSVPFFERYTEAFDPAKGAGGIELWVPIEPAF